MTANRAIAELRDRLAITDTLYRYGSCIDRGDTVGLRAILADELWARYGNRDPVVGADAVVAWIAESTTGVLWQHHLLSVYHVDVDGDHAAALVYHTSHRVLERPRDRERPRRQIPRRAAPVRGRLADLQARVGVPVGRTPHRRHGSPRGDRRPWTYDRRMTRILVTSAAQPPLGP